MKCIQESKPPQVKSDAHSQGDRAVPGKTPGEVASGRVGTPGRRQARPLKVGWRRLALRDSSRDDSGLMGSKPSPQWAFFSEIWIKNDTRRLDWMAGETQCVCGLTYPSPSPPCTLRGVPPARTTGLRRCRSSPPAVSPVTTRLTKGSTSAALLKAPVGSESDGDPGCVREGPEECLRRWPSQPAGAESLRVPAHVQSRFTFLFCCTCTNPYPSSFRLLPTSRWEEKRWLEQNLQVRLLWVPVLRPFSGCRTSPMEHGPEASRWAWRLWGWSPYLGTGLAPWTVFPVKMGSWKTPESSTPLWEAGLSSTPPYTGSRLGSFV